MMRELMEWGRSIPLPEKPWLILGKGPTFARKDQIDLASYNLVALNHAVREQEVDVAHVIDIDVIEDLGDIIADHCRYLLMPRVPHVRSRPGPLPLESYLAASPVLRRMDEEGRLVWYNAATGPKYDESPVIDVRFFSSEAVLSILGHLGVREVRTLGVDGGASYSASFKTEIGTTLLSNGRPSFDEQFAELRRIAAQHDIDLEPLVAPLQVFVGASRREVVPYRVLAHSIHARSSVPVRVERLPPATHRRPVDPANHPRTPFSFSRFLIPSLCGFQGRAVYLDSDMLVFGDIAELAHHDLRGAGVACTVQSAPDEWRENAHFTPGRQFSVMVLDCEKVDWDVDEIVESLDRGEYGYEDLLFDLAIVDDAAIDDSLPATWNCLEELHADTKLLHFTVVPTQPWLSTSNPRREVWLTAFDEAVAAGAVPRGEVEALVAMGGAPDLLDRYDAALVDADDAPASPVDMAFEAALDMSRRTVVMRTRTAAWSALIRGSISIQRRAAASDSPLVHRAARSAAAVVRRVLR